MNLTDVINEAVRPNAQNFQRVKDVPKDPDYVMYKLLMTLSNLAETTSDMFALRGDDSKASYYKQLSERIRAEANAKKNG